MLAGARSKQMLGNIISLLIYEEGNHGFDITFFLIVYYKEGELLVIDYSSMFENGMNIFLQGLSSPEIRTIKFFLIK
jgi:hypothetical protein